MKIEQMTILVKDEIKGRIEAMLFAAGDGVSLNKLATILQMEPELVETILFEMAEAYQQSDRGLRLVCTEKTWQLATKPELFDSISALLGFNQPGTLSRAALETLAIIAYRQPVTRVEIEGLRGVSSGSSVQLLLDRGLIEEAGRKDAPGRPYFYKTTNRFLASVGLNKLADLPNFESFEELSNSTLSQEVQM